MPNPPTIPIAPEVYSADKFQQIFQVLRTYFFQLQQPDQWNVGQLRIEDAPTATEFIAGLRANTVWVDDCGYLKLSGSYDNSVSPGASDVRWLVGSGSPEGVVTAVAGSLYTSTAGGASTTLWVKESGSGNTGWIAK